MLISQKLVAVPHFSDLFWKKIMLDDQNCISALCAFRRYFKLELLTWHKCRNDVNWQKTSFLGVNI